MDLHAERAGTGLDLEDVVRRAGLIAIRKEGSEVKEVTAENFAEALEDSRATVTAQMETEYSKMKGELKKRANAVRPIGFVWPDTLEPERDEKHPSPTPPGIE